MRGFYKFHFVYIHESERRTEKAVKKVNKYLGVDKKRKVFSMAVLMVFMNAAMAMADSGLVSNNRQDTTLRNDKTQVELMGDKHTGSDNIDPTKAGVRV